MIFRGIYCFLSNMYPHPMCYKGVNYLSSEAAYQASKCKYECDKIIFHYADAARAKKLGAQIPIRDDWDNVKLQVMEEVLRIKFSNDKLAKMLLETGDIEIIEDNTWHDTFWGKCNGMGENHLGKLLMKIRDELKSKERESLCYLEKGK